MHVDQLSSTLMLTIDQVSQLTGVRKSTLRYWEKAFEPYLRPARTQSNRREYTLEDVDCVKLIRYLLEEEHLTPAGVRMRLAQMRQEAAAVSRKEGQLLEAKPGSLQETSGLKGVPTS